MEEINLCARNIIVASAAAAAAVSAACTPLRSRKASGWLKVRDQPYLIERKLAILNKRAAQLHLVATLQGLKADNLEERAFLLQDAPQGHRLLVTRKSGTIVVASRNIQAGEALAVYAGELCTLQEALGRNSSAHQWYQADIDLPTGERLVVDATYHRSEIAEVCDVRVLQALAQSSAVHSRSSKPSSQSVNSLCALSRPAGDQVASEDTVATPRVLSGNTAAPDRNSCLLRAAPSGHSVSTRVASDHADPLRLPPSEPLGHVDHLRLPPGEPLGQLDLPRVPPGPSMYKTAVPAGTPVPRSTRLPCSNVPVPLGAAVADSVSVDPAADCVSVDPAADCVSVDPAADSVSVDPAADCVSLHPVADSVSVPTDQLPDVLVCTGSKPCMGLKTPQHLQSSSPNPSHFPLAGGSTAKPHQEVKPSGGCVTPQQLQVASAEVAKPCMKPETSAGVQARQTHNTQGLYSGGSTWADGCGASTGIIGLGSAPAADCGLTGVGAGSTRAHCGSADFGAGSAWADGPNGRLPDVSATRVEHKQERQRFVIKEKLEANVALVGVLDLKGQEFQMLVVAIRDIKAGEELMMDYGDDYWQHRLVELNGDSLADQERQRLIAERDEARRELQLMKDSIRPLVQQIADLKQQLVQQQQQRASSMSVVENYAKQQQQGADMKCEAALLAEPQQRQEEQQQQRREKEEQQEPAVRRYEVSSATKAQQQHEQLQQQQEEKEEACVRCQELLAPDVQQQQQQLQQQAQQHQQQQLGRQCSLRPSFVQDDAAAAPTVKPQQDKPSAVAVVAASADLAAQCSSGKSKQQRVSGISSSSTSPEFTAAVAAAGVGGSPIEEATSPTDLQKQIPQRKRRRLQSAAPDAEAAGTAAAAADADTGAVGRDQNAVAPEEQQQHQEGICHPVSTKHQLAAQQLLQWTRRTLPQQQQRRPAVAANTKVKPAKVKILTPVAAAAAAAGCSGHVGILDSVIRLASAKHAPGAQQQPIASAAPAAISSGRKKVSTQRLKQQSSSTQARKPGVKPVRESTPAASAAVGSGGISTASDRRVLPAKRAAAAAAAAADNSCRKKLFKEPQHQQLPQQQQQQVVVIDLTKDLPKTQHTGDTALSAQLQQQQLEVIAAAEPAVVISDADSVKATPATMATAAAAVVDVAATTDTLACADSSPQQRQQPQQLDVQSHRQQLLDALHRRLRQQQERREASQQEQQRQVDVQGRKQRLLDALHRGRKQQQERRGFSQQQQQQQGSGSSKPSAAITQAAATQQTELTAPLAAAADGGGGIIQQQQLVGSAAAAHQLTTASGPALGSSSSRNAANIPPGSQSVHPAASASGYWQRRQQQQQREKLDPVQKEALVKGAARNFGVLATVLDAPSWDTVLGVARQHRHQRLQTEAESDWQSDGQCCQFGCCVLVQERSAAW